MEPMRDKISISIVESKLTSSNVPDTVLHIKPLEIWNQIPLSFC